jgi:predicted dehydrogenase
MVLLAGGGRHTASYADYALRRPEEVCLRAVAHPDPQQREKLGAQHGIPAKRLFAHWEEALEAPAMGEGVIIATPSAAHVPAALASLAQGYHVLLETPAAQTATDCLRLIQAGVESPRRLFPAHGLRHTAFYRALFNLLRSGRLGRLLHLRHERSFPVWQVTHEYLRQPQKGENPLLFHEGVHELDLLLWLMGEMPESLGAVGTSLHFDLGAAPFATVPPRCIDACPIEADCAYSALGLYRDKRHRAQPTSGYPYSDLPFEGAEAHLPHILEETPWGACVYHTGASLVTYQILTLNCTSGLTASLILNAHSLEEGRRTYIQGTQGTLEAQFIGYESVIHFYDLNGHKENKMKFPSVSGGDGTYGMMGQFAKFLRGEVPAPPPLTSLLQAHLLAFAAEDARLSQYVVRF